MAKNRNRDQQKGPETIKTGSNTQDFDKLARESDRQSKRKPGSQSNSSKQSNNGRGGGK